MPSDKRNSSYRLDFFTVQCRFVCRCAFLPTAAAPVLASWFYQSLPLFYPLLHRWRFAVLTLWLWCKTRVSAELAGALLTLLFAWNVAQHIRKARSETKHSDTPWLPTFKLINEACTLTIEHSMFSVMAGLIVEILFRLFSFFNTALVSLFFINMIPIACKITNFSLHLFVSFLKENTIITSWHAKLLISRIAVSQYTSYLLIFSPLNGHLHLQIF